MADALPHAPCQEEGEQEFKEEVEAYVDHITVPSIPAFILKTTGRQEGSDWRFLMLQSEKVLQDSMARETIHREFSEAILESKRITHSLITYFSINSNIMIPSSTRDKPWQRSIKEWKGVEWESGHQCDDLELWVQQNVEKSQEYTKEAHQWKEPLLPTAMENSINRFIWASSGLFSQYPEVYNLSSTTWIVVLKSIFICHGTPELFRSDNGLQYASKEFSELAKMYSFNYLTSSPWLPWKAW